VFIKIWLVVLASVNIAGLFLNGHTVKHVAVVLYDGKVQKSLLGQGIHYSGPCKVLEGMPGLFMLFGDLKGLVRSTVMSVPETAAGPQGSQSIVLKQCS